MTLALSRPSSMLLFGSMATSPAFAISLRQRAWSIIPLLPRSSNIEADSSYQPIKPSQLLPQISTTTTPGMTMPLSLSPSLQPLSPLSQFLNGLLPQLSPQKLLDALSGLVFAVPKKKTSHSKKRMRQLAGKALKNVTSLNRCPGCGRIKLMNRLCRSCIAEIWTRYNGLNKEGNGFQPEEDGKATFAEIERKRIGKDKNIKRKERKQRIWKAKMAPVYEQRRKLHEEKLKEKQLGAGAREKKGKQRRTPRRPMGAVRRRPTEGAIGKPKEGSKDKKEVKSPKRRSEKAKPKQQNPKVTARIPSRR